MSVIITGMDMPKGCHECQKFLGEDDYCIIQDLAMTEDEWDRYTFDKQYKNCSLKSVDGLLEKITQLHTQENEEGQDMFQAYDVLRAIKEYCEVSE